jgi:electron transport complex protein RnfC
MRRLPAPFWPSRARGCAPSGLPTLTVVIEPDGRDEWIERTPLDYRSLPPERVREALRDAGVVGLGGAVFPSHAKLTAANRVAVEQLVINGAECEPFMTCDDLLMRERAEEIVRGSAIFRDLLAARRVLIGIEDNKPEAVAAMQAAVQRAGRDHEVVAVPDPLPGRRRQAVDPRPDRQGSPGQQALDRTRRAVLQRRHCLYRVSRTGPRRAGDLAHRHPDRQRLQPRNWEVRLGTPLRDLVALGQPKADTNAT